VNAAPPMCHPFYWIFPREFLGNLKGFSWEILGDSPIKEVYKEAVYKVTLK